jgi:catechol 2,3-dioxygenase-like lactoylglutathione lyase family enzyme
MIIKEKSELSMRFLSVRIITADIKRLVRFYESALGLTAKWSTEEFAELGTSVATLAIGSTKTLSLFGGDIATPGSNKTAILEFRVGNVDDDYKRVKELTQNVVQEPTTMPWGNRSLLFRDPDGNLINFFTPVSPEAIKKFDA